MERIGRIPLCFSPSDIPRKSTADPWYPLPHALDIARDIDEHASTLREGIDRFFEIRSAELKCDLAREKHLITRRSVSSVNECIADASLMLAKMGKPFPSRDRCHIDIGCGLGFGLAASSLSYFGDNVVGLDLSPHYLVIADKHLREHGISSPRLYCADICDGWPLPLNRYDVAFISMEGVLEHIKNIPGFFSNILQIRSFPFALYLTVPYRWTIKPESHFNLRFVSWLPRRWQDAHIARRLGVPAIDHVEFYSQRSLRTTLEKYFVPKAIHIEKNSRHPAEAHYLRCVVFIEDLDSFDREALESATATKDTPTRGVAT
ncbi:class I SAM-dependent methyltransferase [uncultured Hyphomicrobium sp.]|uniref:class I SAM-dependent methyltransferase n=1 Tax=uncultured Hyphomicrobium sp. TaxID=194373 RepID=UPI0025E62823|nr:class I SAM-dependent methyltransferase [uncultured Hyphomicrobium sp.]